ncbi:MAG TPA: aspartate aminotransferase family protein [Cytophagales bacterium]|jgi:acetylornithine/N-succinyldiaminopimelate aminotransferase|nr:aspartate aminotransferase family protein [Cytophagales bacterium]
MQSAISQDYINIDQQCYLPTFKRFPLVFDHGKGAHIWDVDGKEYIDALAGIAVNNLGHCHPEVVKAVQEQAATLMHISNFYLSKPQAELSKKLTKLSGLSRVFMSNSGAESVEGAIKLARKYAHKHGRGGTVISMQNSFHGRTLATIATGKKAMQDGFEPIPTGFSQAPFNDIEAIKHLISEDIAAIILEPVQGEGGINVAEKEYLKVLRTLCDEHNIVLIFDEIQCGIGRTGQMFAKDHFGVQPDIMTLAKGLGNGVPVGAILCNEKIADAINFGDHGTTFGGNPLVCAAALATLKVIDDKSLMSEVTRKGEMVKELVHKMSHPGVVEVRGLGLMLGIVFEFETKPIVADMIKKGVLANATAGNVLRLVPPLIISDDDLKKVVETVFSSVKSIEFHA